MKKLYYTIIAIVVFFLLGLTTKHTGPLGTSERYVSGNYITGFMGSTIKTYNFWIIERQVSKRPDRVRTQTNYPFGIESVNAEFKD